MRRLIAILVLLAIMWVPADANEPKLVREIALIPCIGNPLYIFVFDTGSVAMFDLVRVTEDAEVRAIFTRLLDKAKKEITLKEIVLRQDCPKPEGAHT